MNAIDISLNEKFRPFLLKNKEFLAGCDLYIYQAGKFEYEKITDYNVGSLEFNFFSGIEFKPNVINFIFEKFDCRVINDFTDMDTGFCRVKIFMDGVIYDGEAGTMHDATKKALLKISDNAIKKWSLD